MSQNPTQDLRKRIVGEIRRLAEAAGKPPGKQAFARATGIQESAWSGRIWARWGDAVSEAGYEGNALQGRFDTADVLTAIVQACHHYGHIPTVAEMRLYRLTTPAFPSKGAVSGHFPTRADMVAALSQRTPDDPSLAAMLDKEIPKSAAPDAPAPTSDGYVYLLKSGNFYKVGRSDNLERRVKEVRTALPEAVTLVHAIKTDDPPGIEAYWHKRFAQHRRNGEWFSLGNAELAAFKRRKFQ